MNAFGNKKKTDRAPEYGRRRRRDDCGTNIARRRYATRRRSCARRPTTRRVCRQSYAASRAERCSVVVVAAAAWSPRTFHIIFFASRARVVRLDQSSSPSGSVRRVCACAIPCLECVPRAVIARPSVRAQPGTGASAAAAAAMEDSCPLDNAAQQAAEAQRFRKQSKKIGRKLSRRLSLIAKVPNIFNVKFAGNEGSTAPQKSVPLAAAAATADSVVLVHEITVIAPDKTQRLVSTQYTLYTRFLFGSSFQCRLPSTLYSSTLHIRTYRRVRCLPRGFFFCFFFGSLLLYYYYFFFRVLF